MHRYLMYLQEPRAILVERGAQIERFVFVGDGSVVRGSSGMYPLLPQVEPVEIDQAMFDEAWQGAT